MPAFKFDKLKDKAATLINMMAQNRFAPNPNMAIVALIDSSVHENGTSWQENYQELQSALINIVDNLDVRNVTKLIELFPSIVPKKYHGKSCTVEMADDENSTWLVIFD